MATISNKKKTIKELHEGVKQIAEEKKRAVLSALGLSSPQSLSDVFSGRKKLSPAEKETLAGIYGVSADQIDWKEEKKFVV